MEEATWLWTEVSTPVVFEMADCWLALCLLTEVPAVPVVLWARWIAASSFAFTGLTEEPLMV